MHQEEVKLRMFVQGSHAAFEEIVLAYREPAIRFACQYVHDRYVAEDLVQDCFAHLYVYPWKYNFQASFKTYLFTLIRNKSVDYLRKKARRRECAEQDEEARSKMEEMAPGPEQRALELESRQYWEKLLNSLSTEYRSALYMVDVEGMSPKEAAEVQGKTSAGFRVTLFRARKKLRTFVEKEDWYGKPEWD
ncbi:RNA polymerase sigma factor [Paenibacillus sp. CAU 1782]